MRSSIILFLMILSLAVVNCGDGKKPEEKKDAQAEQPKTEEKKDAAPKQDANANTNKVSEYEAFVNNFCALADKVAAANPAEKATLAGEFTEKSGQLATLTKGILDARGTLNEADAKKVDELDQKAKGCAQKATGTADKAKVEAPKDVKDLPKDAKDVKDLKDKIPGKK